VPHFALLSAGTRYGHQRSKSLSQNTGGRLINLAPWPEFNDEDSIVHFLENGRPGAETTRKKVCKPDILIFATGYVPAFPFLDKSYPTPEQADIRQIWKQGDASVGFSEFARPGISRLGRYQRSLTPELHPCIKLAKYVFSTGAIPPLTELQAQLRMLSLHCLQPRTRMSTR
jgi:dimethylaniline monooxygenase (N-oxide forming)